MYILVICNTWRQFEFEWNIGPYKHEVMEQIYPVVLNMFSAIFHVAPLTS